MVRQRAAVIIIENNKILLLYRIKNNKKYYVIPGGGQEEGEKIEQTAIREIKEESTLDVTLGDKLFETCDKFSHCTYFIASSFKGTPKLSGEELIRHSQGNLYEFQWKTKEEIKELNLFPKEIKEKIINLKN